MSEHMLKYSGPVPEGYEPTGEVRKPMPTELLLDVIGPAAVARRAMALESPAIILRKKRWKPAVGDTYLVVGVYISRSAPVRIQEFKWEGYEMDMMLYDSGNCFRTQAEAEAVAEKIRAIFREAQK